MTDNVDGYDAIAGKLRRLDRKLGVRLINSELRKATTPTQRKMRAAAPVGRVLHKSYRGRLLAPGYLKRSLKRRVKRVRKTGNQAVDFGVTREGYYAKFYAEGPYVVTKRKGKRIRSYTLRRHPFFREVFQADEGKMANMFLRGLTAAARQA